MGRLLNEVVLPAGRSLLGYGGNQNGYYNNGYSCADRSGCLAGSIIGAAVFFIIALLLVVCLMVRIRRQRAAALAQPQYYPDPNQGTYGGGQTGPPPMQYTGTGAAQYPAPSAWGPGGPTQQHQGAGSSAVPTNFANDAQRNQWEREQYEKYGEAGLVQGQPVNDVGNGVQLAQYPPK